MRFLIRTVAMLAACLLVCSCNEEQYVPGYVGVWGQICGETHSTIRCYERTWDLGDYRGGVSIGFGGDLVVRTMGWTGRLEFPTCVSYPGTWCEESEHVLIFVYETPSGAAHWLRFEILTLEPYYMTARVGPLNPS